METEAALTRIARLSQSVLRSVRINLIYSRFTSQLKRHAIKSQSSERVGIVERDALSIRENDAENAESYLDQLLIHSEAINRMETTWKSARRYELVYFFLSVFSHDTLFHTFVHNSSVEN